MSLNALSHIATAYAALRTKLGVHETRSTPEGLELRMRGKPSLLLTFAAAEEYAHQIEEAEHG